MVNGNKIRELREAEKLSTIELAEKVHTSQTMISSIEIGTKKPGVELLKRIADYFDLTVDELLTDGKNPDLFAKEQSTA